MGGANTIVLLTSSLTMALAVRCAQMMPKEKNAEEAKIVKANEASFVGDDCSCMLLLGHQVL